MKNFRLRHAVVVALAVLPAVSANAQSAPPLWEAGLAGGWGSSPAYPGSDHRVSRVVAAPWLVYRGPVFRVEDNNVGARLLKTPRIELDVGIGGALPASSNDVALRAGMPDLGTLIELGPRLKVRLTDPQARDQWRLDLPLRAVVEFQDGVHGRGTIFEPEIKWSRRIGAGVDVLAKQASQTFDLYRPRIDTIYEDIRGAGQMLGQLLLRRIAGEPAESLQVLLAPEPNFRTS